MNFCFDIDGTISARPDIFRTLMKSLLDSGHLVFPLTAMQDSEMRDHYEQMRLFQLKNLGLEKGIHFTDVVVCVAPTLDGCGRLKGIFCKENDVVWMVEDTPLYRDEIAKESPSTLCVMMK